MEAVIYGQGYVLASATRACFTCGDDSSVLENGRGDGGQAELF
jgi:hypothetical protein